MRPGAELQVSGGSLAELVQPALYIGKRLLKTVQLALQGAASRLDGRISDGGRIVRRAITQSKAEASTASAAQSQAASEARARYVARRAVT